VLAPPPPPVDPPPSVLINCAGCPTLDGFEFVGVFLFPVVVFFEEFNAELVTFDCVFDVVLPEALDADTVNVCVAELYVEVSGAEAVIVADPLPTIVTSPVLLFTVATEVLLLL
jgi:hypothetical protein